MQRRTRDLDDTIAELYRRHEKGWADIDRTFDANQDPMAAPERTSDYTGLFQRIVLLAPDPVGLG